MLRHFPSRDSSPQGLVELGYEIPSRSCCVGLSFHVVSPSFLPVDNGINGYLKLGKASLGVILHYVAPFKKCKALKLFSLTELGQLFWLCAASGGV